MEAIYTKLYSKYTKLKKEKDRELENLNMEQELKFVNYVAAAEQLIEFVRSENDRLREQINELRSEMASMRVAKDNEKIQYQKLLMEDNRKIKELSDEIQRLQQLDREGSGFHASTNKGESRQIITVGDSLPDALDGSTIANQKRPRQSLPSIQAAVTMSPREELPTGPAQPSTSSYRYTEPACCRRNADISGDGAADISPAKCIFQDVFQWLLGMKFSIVTENEELCISALHESSGLSFSLTLIKNASEEPELVYRMLSLGTCERVAPEWMRDTVVFGPTMCAVFFERVIRAIKHRY
ncbi:PREDICTED: uncharacterized protein LOC109239961 [Nicotiana attenuata]|uniref:DUF7806 domain-containing protein n=1 Tax=Nicotiana attenuata TaxID=49451 RepID=A0A314LB96_NICAT|nr:PREDICTED: uncharacterized protein LOC109239961 [Nicotiana attenuata]OIT38054.1 hypothetical protein A4A49_17287 [Nicotiana attenuata]